MIVNSPVVVPDTLSLVKGSSLIFPLTSLSEFNNKS